MKKLPKSKLGVIVLVVVLIAAIFLPVQLTITDGMLSVETRPTSAYIDTEILRPNAAGDETDIFTIKPHVPPYYHWDKVDEAVADDLGTYVYHGEVTPEYQRDLYNLPAHSGSGTINYIKVYFRLASSHAEATAYGKASIKSDSTVTDGTQQTVAGTTFVTKSQQWNINPADEQPWTWADIDALQIGVNIKGGVGASYAYCTQVYVEINYGTPTVPTVVVDAATSVEETTATLNGGVTDDDNKTITKRGFEWSTTSGVPYESDWSEEGSFGEGSFDHGITGLTVGELCYFRPYAENSVGTGYGSEDTFLTKPLVPTSFTATVDGSDIDLTWALGTGADKAYIRHKADSYPTSRSDGTEVYFDTGTSHTHSSVGGGMHYYRVWSYTTEGGLEQYSDSYDGDYAYVEVGLTLWFQPDRMISGGVLIDRSGLGNHGTITWGSNPSGIEISIGELESYSSYVAPGVDEDIPEVLPPPGEIDMDATTGATGEGLPLYTNFVRAADSLGWTTPVTYAVFFIIVAIVLGVAGLAAVGSSWGFTIGFGGTSAMFGAVVDAGGYHILPWFITIFCVLFALFVGYIWRYT